MPDPQPEFPPDLPPDRQPEPQPGQHTEDPLDAEAARPNPPKRLGFIAIALVFLLLIFGVRWWFTTSQALRDVFVEASSPLCTETEVGGVEIGGTIIAAPDVIAGMRCEVQVNVVNPGRATVQINDVVARGMGPDSGLPIQAVAIDGIEPEDDGEDASYEIDQEIPPGDFVQINIAYEFRDSGCIEGETFTATAWPSVQVSMAKRTKTIATKQAFALRSTTESAC